MKCDKLLHSYPGSRDVVTNKALVPWVAKRMCASVRIGLVTFPRGIGSFVQREDLKSLQTSCFVLEFPRTPQGNPKPSDRIKRHSGKPRGRCRAHFFWNFREVVPMVIPVVISSLVSDPWCLPFWFVVSAMVSDRGVWPAPGRKIVYQSASSISGGRHINKLV